MGCDLSDITVAVTTKSNTKHSTKYGALEKPTIAIKSIRHMQTIGKKNAMIMTICHTNVSPRILPMWSKCHHILHMANVYRDMLCQSMLSTFPVCPTIYCPCGQGVSRYVVSIYAVYMVTIYCSCCQCVSSYII
jgi:hypothetical protein